jgi:hypothetical protein
LIYDPATGLPRSEDVCRALRDGFAFAVGAQRSTDIIDQEVPRLFGQYVITMRVPEWPHSPNWTGEFAAEELTKTSSRQRGSQVAIYNGFTSSLWRPANFCACWEETCECASPVALLHLRFFEDLVLACFFESTMMPTVPVHCVTEAVRRLAASGEVPYAPQWLFTRNSTLGKLMLADIAAAEYEIKQQQEAEREEGGSGGYDFETAVNEWLHQWYALVRSICYHCGCIRLRVSIVPQSGRQ